MNLILVIVAQFMKQKLIKHPHRLQHTNPYPPLQTGQIHHTLHYSGMVQHKTHSSGKVILHSRPPHTHTDARASLLQQIYI